MEQNNIDKCVEEIQKELLIIGGYASYGALAGFWAVNASVLSSNLFRDVGARVAAICKKYSVTIKSIRYEVDIEECFYTLKHLDEVREVKIM
jgi:hypothetical protein